MAADIVDSKYFIAHASDADGFTILFDTDRLARLK
jgi:hypothetical protein